MFSFEIKVNGKLTAHVYGANKCACVKMQGLCEDFQKHKCNYEYEYYEIGSGELIKGTIGHYRDKGILPLVNLIMKDVEKRCTPPQKKTKKKTAKKKGKRK
jgi:hypothetical protein